MNPSDSRLCLCDGWWEQLGYGRQSMENLRISFDEGLIQGSGTDIVGRFMLSGTLAAGGAVVIDKQYLGKHLVKYLGTYDGEGVMSGQWSIESMRGLWMIRIRRLESGAVTEIHELVPNH